MSGREPDEATDDPWHCAGCNAPAKGKKKPCDCVTNVGVRTGPNGYREQTWWDDPPAADARWVAIDEKGNDNFATSIYENDYDGLLVARCNQNGNHPWQAAAILRGLERNRQATPPAASDLRDLMLPLAEAARDSVVRWWAIKTQGAILDADLLAVIEQAAFSALQRYHNAGMAKLVDAEGLNPVLSKEIVGSTPTARTTTPPAASDLRGRLR